MSKISRNPFFVIEALDAGGSQTQTDLLADRLKKAKHAIHQYHFPQEDTATGRLIYDKFLLQLNKQPFSRREQALLFIQDFFSRAEEMQAFLNDTSKKHVVISDRHCTSTMAYQTIGLSGQKRKELLDWLTWLCWQGTPRLPKPTAVFFIDTPVAISLERLKDKKKDFFESKQKLTAIRSSYIRLAQEQKWVVINGAEKGQQRTREAIHQEIMVHVEKLLKKGVR